MNWSISWLKAEFDLPYRTLKQHHDNEIKISSCEWSFDKFSDRMIIDRRIS